MLPGVVGCGIPGVGLMFGGLVGVGVGEGGGLTFPGLPGLEPGIPGLTIPGVWGPCECPISGVANKRHIHKKAKYTIDRFIITEFNVEEVNTKTRAKN